MEETADIHHFKHNPKVNQIKMSFTFVEQSPQVNLEDIRDLTNISS
jgi:hypothetical protein